MEKLTNIQKRQLFEQGWVVIPRVVPIEMVNLARSIINATVENYLDSIQTWHYDLKSDHRLKQLLEKTNSLDLIESALGNDKVVPSKNIQCALRFPGHDCEAECLNPHLDSFHPSVDGQSGKITPFVALVGYFLNDINQDNAGNFTVWPGTHRLFADYFNDHGADPELKLGIPPIKLPEPVQIKASAGDMILAHYQLAHTAAPNLTADIRYAIYFRIHHADRPKDSLDVLTDIWKYWYGMHKFSK